MRPLNGHTPSPEQLPLIRDERPGAVLIRGAAGSGKTSSALLRLEFLSYWWLARREREGITAPVRVQALTYNRTLEGYIRELAENSVEDDPNLELNVSTVAGWNKNIAGFAGPVWDGRMRENVIWQLGRGLGLERSFLLDEVEYALGRFPPDRLVQYVDPSVGRTGRGATPRVDLALRQRLYHEVILPFIAHKQANSLLDWNDIAVLAAATPASDVTRCDVVVVDEAQDFSVNQMRSVVTHLAPLHALTVVIDTAQRIYPRYLDFPEAGVPAFREKHDLPTNYRNTPEIALLARAVLSGLTFDDDATTPGDAIAAAHGAKPMLIAGQFNQQMTWVIDALSAVDLANENAAIMTMWGGGALDYSRKRLRDAGLEYVELQTRKYWPKGDVNVGLTTLHSAKGLEFDHVYILGLNGEMTEHGPDDDDATLDMLRRLFGMAIGRARKTVTIGFKPDDPSRLIDFVPDEMVDRIDL